MPRSRRSSISFPISGALRHAERTRVTLQLKAILQLHPTSQLESGPRVSQIIRVHQLIETLTYWGGGAPNIVQKCSDFELRSAS